MSKQKTVKVSTLKYNEKNPQITDEEKFPLLVKSIVDFPDMMTLRPIVVDESLISLGGNKRLRAINELLEKVKEDDSIFQDNQQLRKILLKNEIPADWVKKASELTELQKKQFIIKDNVNFGSWDWESLTESNDWNLDELSEWGIDTPEFGNHDLVDNVNNADESAEWVDMPDFKAGEKDIKIIIYFESERERETFADEKEIEITKKQNNQWISRL